jgi:hypothetical protein
LEGRRKRDRCGEWREGRGGRNKGVMGNDGKGGVKGRDMGLGRKQRESYLSIRTKILHMGLLAIQVIH